MTNTIDYSKVTQRSDREAFEIAAAHLLKQGVRSGDDQVAHPKCYYRGPNGTKCAIGALIPDDVYQEAWDREPYGARSLYQTPAKEFLPVSQSLAVSLQSIHDICPPERWAEELKRLANAYGWVDWKVP